VVTSTYQEVSVKIKALKFIASTGAVVVDNEEVLQQN